MLGDKAAQDHILRGSDRRRRGYDRRARHMFGGLKADRSIGQRRTHGGAGGGQDDGESGDQHAVRPRCRISPSSVHWKISLFGFWFRLVYLATSISLVRIACPFKAWLCAFAISITLVRFRVVLQKFRMVSRQGMRWCAFALPKANRQIKNYSNLTQRHANPKKPRFFNDYPCTN
jgi:hypothetical protein